MLGAGKYKELTEQDKLLKIKMKEITLYRQGINYIKRMNLSNLKGGEK